MPPFVSRRNEECDTCREMAAKVVDAMRDHLQAESELADAAFVKKDAALAHTANVKAAALLRDRKALIARLRLHSQETHGHWHSPDFVLPGCILRLPGL